VLRLLFKHNISTIDNLVQHCYIPSISTKGASMLNRNLTLEEYIIYNEDNLDSQCIEYLEELVETREEIKELRTKLEVLIGYDA